MVLSPKVKLKQGTVIGGEDVLPNGGRYHFFRGIPYAVPPLGNLRFKAPVPLEKFSVPELECITEGAMPIQQDRVSGNVYCGSEDCLYLNVYKPVCESRKPLPVIVYIYGGGFLTGNGNREKHNPLYLMQEGVIMVTFNYRLGFLGFNSLPEAGIPGNAGLKDQVLVMKWVQENISQFNGDPTNVTLYGHSSGAATVHLHVFSNNSGKLFHKAIMQSGVFLSEKIMRTDEPAQNGWRTRNFAKSLGCSSNDPYDILQFLQDFKNLEEFVKPVAGENNQPFLNEKMPVIPVIEEESPEAVITKNLFEAIKEMNLVKIPILMGYANSEGIFNAGKYVENLGKSEPDFRNFIPSRLNNQFNEEKRTEIANSIRKFFFQDNKIDKTMTNQFCDLFSDHIFTGIIYEVAELHTRFQHESPLYFYRFDFDGQLNLFKKKYKMPHFKGACHGDDLSYIFHMEITPSEPWRQETYKIVSTICKLWANFVKYRNPTPTVDEELGGCIWEPVQKVDNWEDLKLKALIIDEELKMMEKPDEERMAFWRNIRNYHK